MEQNIENIIVSIIAQYLMDDKEGMKKLVSFFLDRVMLEEAKMQVGAKAYERTGSRKAHRNGYRQRSLKTRYGTIELKKPQIREFPFETQVFDRYSRVERATRNAIAESYVQGVSTRKIKEIVSHLGIEELSAASVSNIAKELDKEVEAFLKAPIEKEIRYLFIDATYFKIREHGHYSTQAVFVAIGVDEDGYRRVLGVKVAMSESEAFWMDFFEEMKERGLRGVKLIISDGHSGIRKAVEKSFVGASWQMCHVHFMRIITSKTPKKKWKWVTTKVKEALNSSDETKLEELIEELEKAGLEKAARSVEKYRYDLFNYKAFPQSHWKRIRTTNVLERLNKELKRRGRVVGAFPSVGSLIRLLGSVLSDQNEEWITGRRYLNMEIEKGLYQVLCIR
ncbi:IS256 family transposase [Mesoaciditoga lauensis]|uniref:IS256 family transposase n=1 Tax=Mesoaciditoga lauensis TaxID=1495039 RepID=UPI0009E03AAD|nr:IS256 family transposase [Mesoaciditoga lauensis]